MSKEHDLVKKCIEFHHYQMMGDLAILFVDPEAFKEIIKRRAGVTEQILQEIKALKKVRE